MVSCFCVYVVSFLYVLSQSVGCCYLLFPQEEHEHFILVMGPLCFVLVRCESDLSTSELVSLVLFLLQNWIILI